MTIIVLLFTSISLPLITPVFAADDIGVSQITPASPLYFLKSVREILEFKLALTPNVKFKREAEFVTRRLREVNSLIKTPNEDLIQPTLERYWSSLQELNGLADVQNNKDMIIEVRRIIIRDMGVAQKIYPEVSGVTAKRSLRTMIDRLSRLEQQLIVKLDALHESSDAGKLISSKLSACKFLSKEASSSALNEVEKAVFTDRANECLKGLNCGNSQAGGQQPCPQSKVL